jgi:hypothetical protein
MKPFVWFVVGAVALAALLPRLLPIAGAAPEDGAVAYEFKHLIIPLERRLEEYEKADVLLLEPLRRAGQEGWELVSAYEPDNGLKIQGRASVEFWMKRAYLTRPR